LGNDWFLTTQLVELSTQPGGQWNSSWWARYLWEDSLQILELWGHPEVGNMRGSVAAVGSWVCLKMGYTPNYSHLVGIMIINHWV
jgi:hypothetical protein